MWDTLRHEQRVQLKDTKQRTLATWASKVGLLFGLFFNDDPIPHPEHGAPLPSYAPADNFHGCTSIKSALEDSGVDRRN